MGPSHKWIVSPQDLSPRSHYGLLDLPGRRHGGQKSKLRWEHQGWCESTAGPSGYGDGYDVLPAGLCCLASRGDWQQHSANIFEARSDLGFIGLEKKTWKVATGKTTSRCLALACPKLLVVHWSYQHPNVILSFYLWCWSRWNWDDINIH